MASVTITVTDVTATGPKVEANVMVETRYVGAVEGQPFTPAMLLARHMVLAAERALGTSVTEIETH